MYAFVKVTGGTGRAFEDHCAKLGKEPSEMIQAMVENFVAAKNMPHPPPKDFGSGNEQLVGLYVEMRDTKTALKRQFEKEEEAIKAQMEKVGNMLLAKLNDEKVKSMNTGNGMFYKERVLKPSVSDWEVFHAFMHEQNEKGEDGFRFLERRVTKTQVEDYMKEHGSAPPGVSTLIEFEVRIRRGKDT